MFGKFGVLFGFVIAADAMNGIFDAIFGIPLIIDCCIVWSSSIMRRAICLTDFQLIVILPCRFNQMNLIEN